MEIRRIIEYRLLENNEKVFILTDISEKIPVEIIANYSEVNKLHMNLFR